MENSNFYLVIGTYFQQKDVPGLGFDQQYSQRALVQTIVENAMFSGVIDLQKRVGAFQDKIGNSHIEIISLQKEKNSKGSFVEKLSFAKTYEKGAGNIIFYEVFTEDKESGIQQWFGRWKCGSIEGLVRMLTIRNYKDFSDWETTASKLKMLKVIPEDEIPIRVKEELNSTCISGEDSPENENLDDLPF